VTGWVFASVLLAKDDSAAAACEDRVLVLPPDFAAVIDGATDITGQRFGGQTGGALADRAIAGVYRQFGLTDAMQDPARRFRAAFAVASCRAGV